MFLVNWTASTVWQGRLAEPGGSVASWGHVGPGNAAVSERRALQPGPVQHQATRHRQAAAAWCSGMPLLG